MAKVIITQVKSTIGRPAKQVATMEALGLRGINKSTEKDVNAQVLGMLKKVSHLIKIEEA